MAPERRRCGDCRHFLDDPLELERRAPGLAILSSGFAAARADDGLCALHERYVPAGASCARYAPLNWRAFP
jgi:hypothetical protein